MGLMARCIFCKSETELYGGGVPICVKCSDAGASKRKPPTSEHHVLNVLREDLQSAKERVTAANGSPRILFHPGGIEMEQIDDTLDTRCRFWRGISAELET